MTGPFKARSSNAKGQGRQEWWWMVGLALGGTGSTFTPPLLPTPGMHREVVGSFSREPTVSAARHSIFTR